MTPTPPNNINNVFHNKWGKLSPADIKKISTPQGFYEWMLINAASILAATQAEVDAGIIDDKFVSPLTLTNWIGAGGGGGSFNIDGGDADSVYTPDLYMDGGSA